jgi:hypothetical protein
MKRFALLAVVLLFAAVASAQTVALKRGGSPLSVMHANGCAFGHLASVLNDSNINMEQLHVLPVGTGIVLDSCRMLATKAEARATRIVLLYEENLRANVSLKVDVPDQVKTIDELRTENARLRADMEKCGASKDDCMTRLNIAVENARIEGRRADVAEQYTIITIVAALLVIAAMYFFCCWKRNRMMAAVTHGWRETQAAHDERRRVLDERESAVQKREADADERERALDRREFGETEFNLKPPPAEHGSVDHATDVANEADDVVMVSAGEMDEVEKIVLENETLTRFDARYGDRVFHFEKMQAAVVNSNVRCRCTRCGAIVSRNHAALHVVQKHGK